MIGRGEGVDILIEDHRISCRHATVELAAGGTLLHDGESTNGTWVNGRRVTGVTPLRDGDRIRLGDTELWFFDPGSAPTDPGLGLRPVLPVSSWPSAYGPDGPLSRRTVPRFSALPAVGSVASTRRMVAGRARQLLIMIGGCAALVSWLAGAYLICQ